MALKGHDSAVPLLLHLTRIGTRYTGRPPLTPMSVAHKPRRLSFGTDGGASMDGVPLAQHAQQPLVTHQGVRRPPNDGSQCSGGSESMVELESLSGVPNDLIGVPHDLIGLPEDLLRASLSGAIPVSIRALQVGAVYTLTDCISRTSMKVRFSVSNTR